MITKIGSDALTKEAAGGLVNAAINAGKGLFSTAAGAVRGGYKALGEMGNLASAAGKGFATEAGIARNAAVDAAKAAGKNVNSFTGMGSAIGKGMRGAKLHMDEYWKHMGPTGKLGVATAGTLGMGALGFGGSDQPTTNYNFYQSGYPQQFSGSWQ